ncbi:hypothetical protein SUNI508_11704 [Seiridium unicorne]|uniref:Ankyrin repeat protein n=1 Tax=Seiridium unicorne TaxID=138068 RepID=A0ABR2UGV4_9PEZI
MSHSETQTSTSGEIEFACDQLHKAKDTVDYKLTQPDAFVTEKLDLFRLELRLANDAWEALTEMSATEQDKDQVIAHKQEFMQYKNSIYYAICMDYVDVARLILRTWEAITPGIVGGPIKSKNRREWLAPLLDMAITYGKPNVLKMLLEEGADPNRRYGFQGYPGLGYSVCSKGRHMFDWLDLQYDHHCRDTMESTLDSIGFMGSREMENSGDMFYWEYMNRCSLEDDDDAGLPDKDCLEDMAIQPIHYGYSFGDDGFEAKFTKAALFGTMRLLKAMWSWATENVHEQSQLVRILDQVLLTTLLPWNGCDAVIEYLHGLRAGLMPVPDEKYQAGLIEHCIRHKRPKNAICLLRRGIKTQPPQFPPTYPTTMPEGRVVTIMLSWTSERLIDFLQNCGSLEQIFSGFAPFSP